MSDGTVTWDKYKAGFDAYQACLAKSGYQLYNPHVDEYQLLDFGVPDGAVQSGDDEKCYQFHWGQLDSAWQVAHQDTSESAKIIKACLEAEGISPAEKYATNVKLLQEHNIDVTQCPTGN